MTPAEIPRPQSQRVALYEQQFGRFDSGKNAYWSLRKGRSVTLAEGARFDVDMRAGRLAPARTGATRYRGELVASRDVVPRGPPPPRAFQFHGTRMRLRGMQGILRDTRGRKILARMPVSPPQEKFLHMPTEAKRIDALPATPPPGPARPPAEPLFEAVMRQLREKQAGPATTVMTTRPAFATPARSFASAAPGAAGFDMKKLVLPLALVAGAFVVSKLI